MKRASLIAILIGGLFALICVYRAEAFPQPSRYPISWQLDFDHALPKRIVVQAPGQDTPQAYWYMTFTVTNNTDDDQMFYPIFELLTEEDSNISRSDRAIPKAVFDRIKEDEGNKLLRPLDEVKGKLRIGPSQAQDSVAIWPEAKPRIGAFSIFVTGLSGETLFMKKVDGQFQPIGKDDHPTDDDGHITLVKTLQLDYQVPGDEHSVDVKAIAKGESWIMR